MHQGIEKFRGPVKFSKGRWVGVQCAKPVGRNNGTVKKITYFRCKPKFGMFVPEAKARRMADPLTLELFQTANEELGCVSSAEQLTEAFKALEEAESDGVTLATFCAWKEKQPAENYVDNAPLKKPRETSEDAAPAPEAAAPPSTPSTTDPGPVPVSDTPPVPSAGFEIAEPVSAPSADTDPTPVDNAALGITAELSALGIDSGGAADLSALGIDSGVGDDPALDMDMLGVAGVETGAETEGASLGETNDSIDLDALRDAGIDLDF